jgi:glutamyl-tRNA reductase
MKLFCIGLNHRTAPIDMRERFTGHAGTVAMLRQAGCQELLLLSTCNRVEIYAAAERELSLGEAAGCLAEDHSAQESEVLGSFYRHEGDQCVRHLFHVASGLDSMVVGETEILGQTKRAYEHARSSGAVGPLLHRLCQRAFRVAKQVRTRTDITRGSVSIGSVAVDLAEKIFGDLRGRKVLVLGAGQTSEKTMRALTSRGVSKLWVSNRSAARAEELAEQLGGMAIPFSSWLEQCRAIDILISSTAADAHLLTRESLTPILRERIDRPLFIIDIAVPRDIAPEVNAMEGVYLYDIDSLQMIADDAVELRRQQVERAREIIDEHVDDFCEQIVSLCGDANRPIVCDAQTSATATLRPSEL